jgi:hypothetical protein
LSSALPKYVDSKKTLAICKCLMEAGADAHLNDPILVRLHNLMCFHCLTVLCLSQGLTKRFSKRDMLELIDLFSDYGVDVCDPRT